MWIYNITTKVENAIVEEWLQWVKETHIPAMMSTGLFSHHRFLKLHEHDEHDGKTYILQFFAEEKKSIDLYKRHHEKGMQHQSGHIWRDALVSFSSLLESVQ